MLRNVARLNVPKGVNHDGKTVYNACSVEGILEQLKREMDADPTPEVNHDNYMHMIREYFRCEISKFSLDWFMHTIYSRYIKLHNAMFEYIRWNAALESTQAHKYGMGGLQEHECSSEMVKNINNVPKLYCIDATQKKLFRGPPPKKRKLSVDQLHLPSTLRFNLREPSSDDSEDEKEHIKASSTSSSSPNLRKRKRQHIDFEEAMESLRNKSHENALLFQERIIGSRSLSIVSHVSPPQKKRKKVVKKGMDFVYFHIFHFLLYFTEIKESESQRVSFQGMYSLFISSFFLPVLCKDIGALRELYHIPLYFCFSSSVLLLLNLFTVNISRCEYAVS